MAFNTEKTSNQKMSGRKKFIFQPRMSIQKENLKSKPNKICPEKGLNFQAVKVKLLDLLKIFTP